MSKFKTDLAQNIFKFKYANHPEQSWADKCQNIVDDVMGGLVTNDDKQQMKKYIEEKKFLPGGRYIYYGGKPAEFYNNCASGDTRLLTDKGWVRFDSVEGEEVFVLSPVDGKYKPAVMYSHEEQDLYEITFSPVRGKSKVQYKTKFTRDHKWPLKNGATTEEIEVGDVVPANMFSLDYNDEGFAHGFVFGDGNINGQLRLCAEKDLEHLGRLQKVATSVKYPPFAKGDPCLYFKQGKSVWKSLPETDDPEYVASFIMGWIAADSHDNRVLQSISKENLEWFVEHAPFAGLVPSGQIRKEVRDVAIGDYNYRDHVLYSINYSTGSKWQGFKVIDIQYIGKEQVYCPHEPEYNQIVIDHGIHTFNCALLRGEEDTREEWAALMERSTSWLMTGAGIGVDYSVFRPSGSYLNRTGGEASGPIPLMHAINEIGRNVKQGGSRRCLPEGSFVHTKRGLIRIEDVEENKDEALTYDGYRKVKNKFYQGEQELLTIYTQTGSFECTPNHKMAVLTSVYGDYKWVKAEDLQEGDRLLHTTSVISGVETRLPQSSYVRPERAYTAKPIEIPELDEGMAWFIGYYHANGHSAIRYQGGRKGKRNSVICISVPNTAPQVVEKCYEQLSRFGVNVRIKDGYGACQLVKATSVELALWMAEHIKTSNEEFDVPDFIMQGTPEVRSAYVAGVMDGDGSVSSRPIQIMSCIHEGYLRQLQTVCSSLGVATRVKMNRPAQGNWKPLYQLNLKGTKQERQFNSTAGRYLIYKTEPPRVRKSEQFSYSLPAGMLKTSLPEHRAGYHQNYKVNCPIDLWEEISGVSCDFTPVQVISVEQGGVSETWDIEVEDRHEFYCNGFLTHNSAIYASLNWQHDDAEAFLRAKNWHEMPVGHTGYTLWDAKQDNFDFPAPLDMTNISLNYDDGFLNQIKDGNLPTTFVDNCRQALSTAEPGFSFNFGEKENETLRNACTEVCSEDDSDVCNLGSVNLGVIDSLEELKDVVRLASEFLVCGTLKAQLPYDKVYKIREKNRRLGLGLMGIHEWLLKRSYPYEVTPELHSWLRNYEVHSEDAANQLCDKLGISRPVAYRAIAPTGTIGILSSTSTGIEPLYAVAYKRRYLQGNNWKYEYVVDNTAKIMIDEYGVDPNDIETAADLATNPEKRIRFQADVQDYVDMAISSTINLPAWGSEHNNEDTLPEFARTLAKYAPRLRGFTCYPDGARGGQPITTVDYHEALHHQGTVFEENQESQCRSGICGI